MVIQLDRRPGHDLLVLGYMLAIAIALALLAYGWYRPAGTWRVEAPGPAQNAPAIAAGGPLPGVETAVRRLGGGLARLFRGASRPASSGSRRCRAGRRGS